MRRDGSTDTAVDQPDAPASSSDAPGAGDAGDRSGISELLVKLATIPETPGALAPLPRRGDALGRFEILSELGRGGFGVVYEAYDLRLRRRVALKVLRPGRRARSTSDVEWLRREADAIAQLAHPNIVTLYDAGEHEGTTFLVLELLRGETLEDRLNRGPLSPREALRVATDVARGLARAHAAGVVHRDLKPANVFLTDDGAAKVLDFGLAVLFGEQGVVEGGTPAFMAPEQRRGEPGDARTDVYAAGLLLHLMLTGMLPEAGPPAANARLGRAGKPRPLPRPIRAVLRRALAADAAARPCDGGELLRSLGRAERSLARARLRVAAATLALACTTFVAAWITLRDEPATPPGERVTVAVADVVNESGEPVLDGLGGLLVTSLEQSRRLRVLTPTRIADLLRQLGASGVERIDAEQARVAARRAGARVYLVPTVRRFDRKYAVEVAAVDPLTEEYAFTLREEGDGRDAILGMIDRLSRRVRRALAERARDVEASEVTLAHAVTASLEAYEHYYRGQVCADRVVRTGAFFDECAAEFDRAVELDPRFALAHFHRSWNRGHDQSFEGGEGELLEPALRSLDRLPAKDRGLVLGWKAQLDGDHEAALAHYRAVVEAYPEEKRPVFQLGEIFFHHGDPEASIPYFERVLELDPGFGWALDHLVWTLGVLGQRERL